jgi:histidine decarboxylase
MQEETRQKLQSYMSAVKERAHCFLGYPVAVDFDYTELYPLLQYPLNNLGDPWVESTYDLNSRSIEREVIGFFADLFNAPTHNAWGYITNGGSEGNLYALYVARDLYPQAIVYYSESTHYSIQKNIHLLNIPSIVVKATASGEMDYADLNDAAHQHRNKPAIVVANIGTTMTEAKDDVREIKKALKNSAIRSHYIHCDGALAGTYAALLDQGHTFDFAAGADSVAVSGHKFIGSPIPCGVVVVKKNYKDRIGHAIPYIGTLDTTITGSRNGHAPVFLWYALQKFGREGLKKRAEQCMKLAEYTLHKLRGMGIEAWRNPHALTVVFPKPSQALCIKWQLASEGPWAHVLCMPGRSQTLIDEFLQDLAEDKNP